MRYRRCRPEDLRDPTLRVITILLRSCRSGLPRCSSQPEQITIRLRLYYTCEGVHVNAGLIVAYEPTKMCLIPRDDGVPRPLNINCVFYVNEWTKSFDLITIKINRIRRPVLSTIYTDEYLTIIHLI